MVRDYSGRCLRILSAPPDKLYRPANELLGKTLHEGFRKPEADKILGYIRQAIDTQTSVRGQYELTIEGSVVYFSATFSPLEEDSVLIVTHDVTELRQVEKQLEIHALITNNIAEGICVIRAADSTILYTNPKLEQMFGYEPCELIGENVALLHYESASGESQAKVSDLIERITHQNKLMYERHSVKKNGENFWCSVTASSLYHPKYGTVLLEIQSEIETSPAMHNHY